MVLPSFEDIDDAFEAVEYLEEINKDEEDEFDAYKQPYNPLLEKTDRWDNRNYEPTEWELYLKELGTQGY